MDVLSPWHGPPRVVASGKTLCYVLNVWVAEATGPVNRWERKIWQFCGQMTEEFLPRKTHNVTGSQSGCSCKPKSHDSIVPYGILPYQGLRVCAAARSKNVCSVLQNSPVLLAGCKFLRYIRGRGLLRKDPPR
jgi:hypothetical protein